MTAANTPQPGATTVPSAEAERRRIWQSDSAGLVVYVILAVLFVVAVIAIILATRA